MSDSPLPSSPASFSLFEDEEQILAQAGVLPECFGNGDHAIREHFEALVGAFRQSVREKQRLVRLGDRQQEQLRQVSSELKEKNVLLEEQARHLMVLNTELAHEVETRKLLEMELRVLATTDPLTGLYNRRRLLELGQYEIQREGRNRRGLALLVLDLDHFKRVNDRHGHGVGDEALRRFASTCKTCLRPLDSIGRIGGEEFAILLPETQEEDAMQVAERVRVNLAACPIPAGNDSIFITVSIGLVLAGEQEAFPALLARGDACLYAAKDAGRNRVVLG